MILFYQRLFCSSVGGILFFMTFLSDAGGHLDQGINLEWPNVFKKKLDKLDKIISKVTNWTRVLAHNQQAKLQQCIQ